ncbi:hypothetical protein GQ44DRAFT_713012 [Phaeosphaeriaceae sp. PMI808]|nr:hypothetical protein GQ44DRAFT_713012 [Phaeosphaeriaceae sp. PMI808]
MLIFFGCIVVFKERGRLCPPSCPNLSEQFPQSRKIVPTKMSNTFHSTSVGRLKKLLSSPF